MADTMFLKGRAHRFGDDVNTDEIIASRYLNLTDAKELGAHCMQTLDKDFVKNTSIGDALVTGKKPGYDWSREHAPLAIKGAGISCVVAESFARIFYRNALNIGLPIFEIRNAAEIKAGDELEIDLASGSIDDKTRHMSFKANAFPDFMRSIINAGGLINWLNEDTTYGVRKTT